MGKILPKFVLTQLQIGDAQSLTMHWAGGDYINTDS